MPRFKVDHSNKAILEEAFRNIPTPEPSTPSIPAPTRSLQKLSAIKRFWLEQSATCNSKGQSHRSRKSAALLADDSSQLHSSPHDREKPVRIGNVSIGGSTVSWICGPAIVTSVAQIAAINSTLQKLGIRFIRVKAFHSRTNEENLKLGDVVGLQLLSTTAKRFGLHVIGELLRPEDLDETIQHCDVIEVGAPLCNDTSLLRHLGSIDKVILLIRNLSVCLDDYLSSLRYIEEGGRARIILSDTGMRFHENSKNTVLDVTTILRLRKERPYPIVIDFSHKTEHAHLEKDRDLDYEQIAKSAIVAGASGFLTQLHLRYIDGGERPPRSFYPEELGSFMKRMGALKFTLNALAHHRFEDSR